MKKEKLHSRVLKDLILEQKITTMPEMKAALGTLVDATIFRKLKELSYLRSYSHRGKYYTLPQVARFDEQGLWSYRNVHFSRQGSLLSTIEYFVRHSMAGYFENELENQLQVGVRTAVLKLLKENRIWREKVSGRYLYCSSEKKVGKGATRYRPGGGRACCVLRLQGGLIKHPAQQLSADSTLALAA